MLPHELNTPLNAIVGYADMLVSDIEDMETDEVVDAGKAIRQAARRLQGLTERFLLFAQIELLHANPAESAPLVNERAGGVADLVGRLARQTARERTRGEDLDLAVAEATVKVSADLFSKMLGEVVDNAFKFSAPGSKVKIRSENEPGIHRVTVSDEGRGMRPDQAATIGAYQQFERKLNEQQGTGLGLVVAKRLAELHGGALRIESEYGQGTTVILEIPRIEE